MGWLFTRGATIADVREAILRDLRASQSGYEIITYRSTNRGHHLWVAMRPKTDHPRAAEVSSFVILYLLEMRGGRGTMESGYKDIDEDCGPCEKDCPVALLDLTGPDDAPGRSEWSRQWRAGVRRRAAAGG